MKARLNKRERKAQQLLEHYATCERLAEYLGVENPDGKKLSVSLLKIEREAHNAATAQCNGEAYGGQPFRNEDHWDAFKSGITAQVERAISRKRAVSLPGFFVNGDPCGYALKIDNESPEGNALIGAVRLHTDWGGYGILSPDIDGN